MKKLNNKGKAWIWMTSLVVLLIFGLFYITLDDVVKNILFPTAVDLGEPVPLFVRLAWDFMPIVVVLGLLIFVINKSQREYGYA